MRPPYPLPASSTKGPGEETCRLSSKKSPLIGGQVFFPPPDRAELSFRPFKPRRSRDLCTNPQVRDVVRGSTPLVFLRRRRPPLRTSVSVYPSENARAHSPSPLSPLSFCVASVLVGGCCSAVGSWFYTLLFPPPFPISPTNPPAGKPPPPLPWVHEQTTRKTLQTFPFATSTAPNPSLSPIEGLTVLQPGPFLTLFHDTTRGSDYNTQARTFFQTGQLPSGGQSAPLREDPSVKRPHVEKCSPGEQIGL